MKDVTLRPNSHSTRRQPLHPSSVILPPLTRPGFSLVEMLAAMAALAIVVGLAVSLARSVRRQASDQFTKDLLARLDVLVRRYAERHRALPVVPAFVTGEREQGKAAEGNGGKPGRGGKEKAGREEREKGGGEREKRSTREGGKRKSGDAEDDNDSSPSSATAPLPLAPSSPSPPLTRPDDALPPEAELHRNADANNRAIVRALAGEARRGPAGFRDLPPSFYAQGTLYDAWGTPVVYLPAMHPAIGMAMENRPFFLSAGPDRCFHTSEDNLLSYEQAIPADP